MIANAQTLIDSKSVKTRRIPGCVAMASGWKQHAHLSMSRSFAAAGAVYVVMKAYAG